MVAMEGHALPWLATNELFFYQTGEKMIDAEVDVLIQGLEDKQGSVNYEGKIIRPEYYLLIKWFSICLGTGQ